MIQRIDQQHADRTDFRAIGRVIAPWGRRIGALRFETDGAWKRQGTTVDGLAKELRLALQYPEGAGAKSAPRSCPENRGRQRAGATRVTRPAFTKIAASLAPPSIYGTLP